MVIKVSVLFIFDNMLPKTSVTGHPYSKEKSLFFLNFALQHCHRLCLTFHYATVYTLGHLEFGQTCLKKSRLLNSHTMTLVQLVHNTCSLYDIRPYKYN